MPNSMITNDAPNNGPDKRLQTDSKPPQGYQRLEFDDVTAPKLTHALFRFPAKFHPPVAHALLAAYTTPGQTVLDPFCGSGTLLVAAAADGRRAIGSDIDPVAVFVSQIKTHRFQPNRLRASWSVVRLALERTSQLSRLGEDIRFADIPADEFDRALETENLWVPEIPNLLHWFRRYVVLEMSRMLRAIDQAEIPASHRLFFRLIFASVIRKVSNADPVPVSGLEVTAHMRRREAKGRSICPLAAFVRSAERGLDAASEYWKSATLPKAISVQNVDARYLSLESENKADAIITSPPYHNAVDYYRRHQLEMFWLGFTASRQERLELMPKYIGRSNVSSRDPIMERSDQMGPLAQKWYETIHTVSEQRSTSFLHYVLSMRDAIRNLAAAISEDAPAVFVLGHSAWNGNELPTSDLFIEMAGDDFRLEDRLWYPTKNRYMSYKRRNGADVNQEYVLVFRRTASQAPEPETIRRS